MPMKWFDIILMHLHSTFQSGDFKDDYRRILCLAEAETQMVKAEMKKPRSFHESAKVIMSVSL